MRPEMSKPEQDTDKRTSPCENRDRRRHKRAQRWSRFTSFTNAFFFILAGLAAVWMVVLAAMADAQEQWTLIPYAIALWAAIAYVLLPRIYRLATGALVPDYFIGRARTDTGLLGDVVNIAWDGATENIHRVMQAAGWTLAKPITLASSIGIVNSVLTHRPYPDAPVSPLFLFGRQQDFAYEMTVGGSANKRHHIRFWRCPDDWPLPGGRYVDWLSAASFDKGVRLSAFTLQVTHSTAPDVDRERDFTLETVRSADPGVRISWIRKFSTAFHARNGGGDLVRTDGDLPVVDVRSLPPDVPQLQVGQGVASEVLGRPATIKEVRERNPIPASLWLVAVLTIAWALRDFVEIFSASGDMPAYYALAVIALLGALAATVWGRSSGRFALMSVYALLVVLHFTQWVSHQMVTDVGAVTRLAVATLMLVVLSSSAVTNYTSTFTRWRHHREWSETIPD